MSSTYRSCPSGNARNMHDRCSIPIPTIRPIEEQIVSQTKILRYFLSFDPCYDFSYFATSFPIIKESSWSSKFAALRNTKRMMEASSKRTMFNQAAEI
jgi:hypothetical protein